MTNIKSVELAELARVFVERFCDLPKGATIHSFVAVDHHTIAVIAVDWTVGKGQYGMFSFCIDARECVGLTVERVIEILRLRLDSCLRDAEEKGLLPKVTS